MESMDIASLIPKDTIAQVCDEEMVESWCSRGYRLVAIVYGDQLAPTYENTTEPADQSNGYCSRVISTTKSVVLRKPRFVMAQDGVVALQDKQTEIERLQEEARKADHILKGELQKVKVLTEDVERITSERNRWGETLREVRDELATERASKRRLEGDIGKIRSAIGELRMKEILGTG